MALKDDKYTLDSPRKAASLLSLFAPPIPIPINYDDGIINEEESNRKRSLTTAEVMNDTSVGSVQTNQNIDKLPYDEVNDSYTKQYCSYDGTSMTRDNFLSIESSPLLRAETQIKSNNVKSYSGWQSSSQEDDDNVKYTSLLLGASAVKNPTNSSPTKMNGYDPYYPDFEQTPQKTAHEQLHTIFAENTYMTPSLSTNRKSPPSYRYPKPFGTPFEEDQKLRSPQKAGKSVKNFLDTFSKPLFEPSTWVGAFVFLLFHNVYCLVMGAAIIRPYAATSLVGPMTKMAALGIILGSPIYWWKLSDEIPALYPSVDLFSAPFLANIASLVDSELHNDASISPDENDEYFLATFTFLASLSLLISGTCLILASVFKLANIGAFLPFPVLCGFFTSVGVLSWTLAFKVDTNGKTVDEVFFSNDWNLIQNSLVHHIPTLLFGSILKYAGPKHPLFVVGIVFCIVGIFYSVMFIFHIPMSEMIANGWFWSSSDLHYQTPNVMRPSEWSTPLPFGWIVGLLNGKVHWKSVRKGLDTSIALGVLYLIRCSIHAAALKKNVSNLVRVEKVLVENDNEHQSNQLDDITSNNTVRLHRRNFSENLDVENVPLVLSGNTLAPLTHSTRTVAAKPTNASLKDILYPYGINQCWGALLGSFAVVPPVSASNTMFTLRAEKLPPQIVSVLILSALYFSDFNMVGFIPKAAFSSMLFLGFTDLIQTWGINSYFKTKEKMEWLVVPTIVVLAFTVGLLQSVFIGLAMSTFLFVASFFRSGVVKYASNGLKIRSTIERPMKVTRLLDQIADQIQILVLQNYLFFGNASSILNYITSMFDEAPNTIDPRFIPPKPKIIILDLTLVTGMDTSAVDILSDILNKCKSNECKLFLSGVSTSLRQVLTLCGVKPEITIDNSKRFLRFFNELDAAIGKAEDALIDYGQLDEDMDQLNVFHFGFRRALELIDEEHSTDVQNHLVKLEEYTQAIDVEAGEVLYRDRDIERGLFFIEYGIIKIERNPNLTFGRGMSTNGMNPFLNSDTLNATRFRSETIGREIAMLKASGRDVKTKEFNSRIARVGPGWILGLVEVLSGSMNSGQTIAVTKSRLHYISYSQLSELESKDPVLILQLYKLLSYLMAKRQENTIAQLGTLQSIMSAPALKKPVSRRDSNSLMT